MLLAAAGALVAPVVGVSSAAAQPASDATNNAAVTAAIGLMANEFNFTVTPLLGTRIFVTNRNTRVYTSALM